jgi:hypothetical protein
MCSPASFKHEDVFKLYFAHAADRLFHGEDDQSFFETVCFGIVVTEMVEVGLAMHSRAHRLKTSHYTLIKHVAKNIPCKCLDDLKQEINSRPKQGIRQVEDAYMTLLSAEHAR